MVKRLGAAAVAALLLAGCATQMSEDECATADWFALGDRDGLYGEAAEKFDERASQCAAYGTAADAEAYDRGRARGLRNYCTPQSGYDAGRNGRPYRGVCPIETERAFLEEYEVGRELHDLDSAHKSAVAAYESALSSLESHRHSLRRARERLRKDDLSDEERSKLTRDMDRHRREIERLERELPRLEYEIDAAYGRLEDYREHLRRR